MYSSIKHQSSVVQPQLLLHQPDNILWSTSAKDSYPLMEGYPGGSDGKESTCSVGDLGLILELGSLLSWRRAWQTTPVFLPGKSPWTEESGELQSMGSQRVG